MLNPDEIKLTQYSHGAGCGCKIAPDILEKIILEHDTFHYPKLVVGNDKRDDAAVFEFNDEEYVISTTDFFMPIVDDPLHFGKIAAVNAISDIYAMGGSPMMAVAILGWPVEKIDIKVAGRVLDGGRSICSKAGIPLAGGHSIDTEEPIFGLAVTGKVKKEHLKTNHHAMEGDLIYLTKPLGIGLITTAQKRGIVKEADLNSAMNSMLTLNDLGVVLGKLNYVHAMTDVTGFGLLGHLIEVCEGSDCSAEIDFKSIPTFSNIDYYIDEGSYPGGTNRNWNSYSEKVSKLSYDKRIILSDPQTSGGLLVFVDPHKKSEFEEILRNQNSYSVPIGEITKPNSSQLVMVK